MLIELLCITAVYAGAVAYAKWVAGYRGRSRKERRRYVLVAGNHESQIEWYLRSLRRFSRRSGTDVQMTIWLRDSSDETGSIVRRMARIDDGIDWTDAIGSADHMRDPVPFAGMTAASAKMSGPVSGGFGKVASGVGAAEVDGSGLDLKGTGGAEWPGVGDGAEPAIGEGTALAGAEGTEQAVGEGTALAGADWTDAGLYAGESGTEPSADAGGQWTDTRLEAVRPIWIELSKPEDVARLPI